MKRHCLYSLILLPVFLLLASAQPAEKLSAEPDKYIALTFDDGPRAQTTELLLDGLWERGAKVTFFVVGEQIAGNEELIYRMANEGHQIGNHTFHHADLQKLSPAEVVTEINKTEVSLTALLGSGSYWLRPPWGLVNRSQQKLVHTPMIHWSVDPEDWKVLNTRQVADHIIQEAKDGDIVLLHDYYPTSVEAALLAIDALQKQGYQFVTVEELFRLEGVEPQEGVLYKNPKTKSTLL